MAWNEPGGNKPDPWGGGNRNDGGPPDLDEALRKMQEKLRGIFGGSGGTGGGVNGTLIGIVIVALAIGYMLFGIKIINEQERGVVLRLGNYHRTLSPGLNWAPPIVDKVFPVNITQVRGHSIDSRAMLTGDLNIVEVDLSVQYVIKNAEDFVLNVREPEVSLTEAADSALRHVVGTNEMHEVLTEGRGQVAVEVSARLQEYLDNYGTGILVDKVNVEETTPPREVQSAFDDVNRAREDEERVKNEAQAYANGVIPDARGNAQRIIEEANGYRQQVVSEAQGEARRFEKLLTEYQKAPQVTRERLYLDAVQAVMSRSSKVLMDVEGGNNLLYLPLDKMIEQSATQAASQSGVSEAVISEVERRVLNRMRQEQPPTRRRERR